MAATNNNNNNNNNTFTRRLQYIRYSPLSRLYQNVRVVNVYIVSSDYAHVFPFALGVFIGRNTGGGKHTVNAAGEEKGRKGGERRRKEEKGEERRKKGDKEEEEVMEEGGKERYPETVRKDGMC